MKFVVKSDPVADVSSAEGLESDDPDADEIDDRLIVEFELVALQRHPQIEFQYAAGLARPSITVSKKR